MFCANISGSVTVGKRPTESVSGQSGSAPTTSPAVSLAQQLGSSRPSSSLSTRTGAADGRPETQIVKADSDETFLKQSCSNDNDNIVSTPLLTKFINCQQPALMMLHSVISEGMAPNIMVTIHSVQTPMMLDSGAEVSVLPLTLFQSFSSFFY